MRKKAQVPEEHLARFEKLKANPLTLPRDCPLMPSIKTPGGWRRTRRLMAKIKTLPAGTRIVLDSVAMREFVPWYRVHVDGSAVAGWMNATLFYGSV
jgi:hypothetical protein